MEHEQTIPEQRKEAESAPEPGTPDAAAAAPRRRGTRTVLLIAGAVVLGVLAGTITGYAIQYDREPTPLAPLAQQVIEIPDPLAPIDSTTLRSINANRWVKTDDDLTKLLLDAPGNAKAGMSGTESPDAFAADWYKAPGQGLTFQTRHGVRRIAARSWSENDRDFFTVRLFQYRDRSGASGYQSDHSYMSGKEYAGNEGKDFPGVPAQFGHMWIDSKSTQEPGYHPVRSARVIARRGDMVMEIKYENNRGDVDEDRLVDVAKRQWERL
ncbi:hypothetical protein ABZY57_05300 [Streptomyces sp. NPDC006450]|uniref:hypothetical protein n=1 Tax=Streptomyces sp. NPDC006450 TaxID=3155458 RepID=UPI0033B54045